MIKSLSSSFLLYCNKSNSKTGLHIQLILNEPEGFSGKMAHYGNFTAVKNYIVMAGAKGMDREIGYYGETQGKAHRSKNISKITKTDKNYPEWYIKGIESALLAPTAINQQKFRFSLSGEKVVSVAGKGFYTDMDLGIAQYHFDIASGRENFGLKV